MLCSWLANAECVTPPVEYYGFESVEFNGDVLKISLKRIIDALPYRTGGLSFLTVEGVEGFEKIGSSEFLLSAHRLTDQYLSMRVHASYGGVYCSVISISQHFQDEIASLGLKHIIIYWVK